MSLVNLSNVKAQSFDVLPAGKYNVTCTGAAVMDTKSGTGQYIQAEFTLSNGRKLYHNFNIKNANEKAVDIGLSQLKSFLTVSGYATPDNLTDVLSLEGLKCAVKTKVKTSEEYGDKAEISAFIPTLAEELRAQENIPF